MNNYVASWRVVTVVVVFVVVVVVVFIAHAHIAWHGLWLLHLLAHVLSQA